MESNIPYPMSAGLNEEQHERLNNQHVSYHRNITDGSYVGVNLSSGYRFAPEEDELITHYLNKKINNQLAKYIQFSDVNVYKHTPEELAEKYPSLGKDEWYFFSPRDRKYLHGNRPNRAAGNGFWKATGADRKIYHNDVCIGSKKCLVFYEGKPQKGNKTNWIMHEYVADQPRRQSSGPNDMRLDDCVLCRIYRKPDRPPKGKEEETDDDATDDAAKCCKTEKPAAGRRRKTEQNGTNQQQNLPLQQNIQGQGNLQVQPQTHPMQPQNLQAVQFSLMEAGNLQVQPQTHPMQPQNLQAVQFSLMEAGNHNLGGQLDYHLERAPEATRQIHYDHLENGLEAFNDLVSLEMVEHQTYHSVFHSGFGHPSTLPDQNFNDFDPFSSTGYFEPNPPSFSNNDHSQDGH